jgi:hypothetical protein
MESAGRPVSSDGRDGLFDGTDVRQRKIADLKERNIESFVIEREWNEDYLSVHFSFPPSSLFPLRIDDLHSIALRQRDHLFVGRREVVDSDGHHHTVISVRPLQCSIQRCETFLQIVILIVLY